MGDVALGYLEPLRNKRRHQVAIGIITDYEVRAPTQFRQQLTLGFKRITFQVGPDFET